MSADNKVAQDGFLSTMVKDVIDSIFTPGVNSGLLKAMNISFVFLFITLAIFAVLTGFNIHVVALNVIAFCLFCSINWFVVELKKANPNSSDPDQSNTSSSAPSSSSSSAPSTKSRIRSKKLL